MYIGQSKREFAGLTKARRVLQVLNSASQRWARARHSAITAGSTAMAQQSTPQGKFSPLLVYPKPKVTAYGHLTNCSLQPEAYAGSIYTNEY